MGEYQRKLRARLAGRVADIPGRGRATEPQPMTGREFQRRRRMFCVVEGIVYVTSLEDSRYHREWMDDLGQDRMDDRTYARSPRGYYLAPDLVWYRGTFEGVGMRAIREHLQEVADIMDLPTDTRVYSGARSGPDDVLKGETMVGTIKDLLGLDPSPTG